MSVIPAGLKVNSRKVGERSGFFRCREASAVIEQ
jgi:hypothetical protein